MVAFLVYLFFVFFSSSSPSDSLMTRRIDELLTSLSWKRRKQSKFILYADYTLLPEQHQTSVFDSIFSDLPYIRNCSRNTCHRMTLFFCFVFTAVPLSYCEQHKPCVRFDRTEQAIFGLNWSTRKTNVELFYWTLKDRFEGRASQNCSIAPKTRLLALIKMHAPFSENAEGLHCHFFWWLYE